MSLRGYKLAEALRQEAADVRIESRAALMREAADEIDRLIDAVRRASDSIRSRDEELERGK